MLHVLSSDDLQSEVWYTVPQLLAHFFCLYQRGLSAIRYRIIAFPFSAASTRRFAKPALYISLILKPVENGMNDSQLCRALQCFGELVAYRYAIRFIDQHRDGQQYHFFKFAEVCAFHFQVLIT
jgi:hypothetical protein